MKLTGFTRIIVQSTPPELIKKAEKLLNVKLNAIVKKKLTKIIEAFKNQVLHGGRHKHRFFRMTDRTVRFHIAKPSKKSYIVNVKERFPLKKTERIPGAFKRVIKIAKPTEIEVRTPSPQVSVYGFSSEEKIALSLPTAATSPLLTEDHRISSSLQEAKTLFSELDLRVLSPLPWQKREELFSFDDKELAVIYEQKESHEDTFTIPLTYAEKEELDREACSGYSTPEAIIKARGKLTFCLGTPAKMAPTSGQLVSRLASPKPLRSQSEFSTRGSGSLVSSPSTTPTSSSKLRWTQLDRGEVENTEKSSQGASSHRCSLSFEEEEPIGFVAIPIPRPKKEGELFFCGAPQTPSALSKKT